MSNALVNKGLTVIGKPSEENRPIVVIGTARGGTSMIAGALVKLGVFMGDQSVAPVYEDVRLSALMEKGDYNAARQVANEYTQTHGKWGWKRPSAIARLNETNEALGSPSYVFIYKDILSIAQRNSISMLSQILPTMRKTLEQYGLTLDFLATQEPHALLASYDKAVSDPKHFINSLIEFYQLTPTEEQKQQAIDFIQPDPADYLEHTRITKAEGRLDGVKGRTIFGWARLIHTTQPAIVGIFLNGRHIASTPADKPRPDLLEKFGCACAFTYEVPVDVELQPGDEIRARVQREIRDLPNSGCTI